MAKTKPPTAQDLYRARKQREEAERDACLPPGLINHGNTCFMNSVLQGLIATRLLRDLVLFTPLGDHTQKLLGSAAQQLLGSSSATSGTSLIASQRSPQLTNGHTLGERYEQEWVQGMPLGDVFIVSMYKAWKLQRLKKRESMSPKEILSAIGRKYDQYQDFGQQDAHEFLRQLLDAMRMEEYDIIKKRQPPPPPTKRKRARNTTLIPAPPPRKASTSSLPPLPSSTEVVDPSGDYILVNASDAGETATSPASEAPPELVLPAIPEEQLIPFVDMIFGGRLTSILICQTCKHVSQSYEDFNDLSLSIKPDEFGKGQRKRDKVLQIFGKLRGASTGSPVTPQFITPSDFANSTRAELAASSLSEVVPSTPTQLSVTPFEDPRHALGMGLRRPSSVPPSPSQRVEDESEPEFPMFENRRRSLDIRDAAQKSEADDMVINIVAPEPTKPDRIEFVEPAMVDRSEKKDKVDNWAKIGRRLSLGLKKSNKRESRSMDRDPRALGSATLSVSPTPGTSSQAVSDTETDVGVRPLSTPRLRTESQSVPVPVPNIKREKSPQPPKPSSQEAAYLRKILSDISTPSSNPFAMFKPPQHSGGSSSPPTATTAAQLWSKMGQLSNIEECLRLFTAVENLDGENMVGCRRCWKIANGVYIPPPRVNGQCVEADSDSEENDKADVEDEGTGSLSMPPGLDRHPNSAPSTPDPFTAQSRSSSIVSLEDPSDDSVSVSSVPTTMGASSKSRPPSLALNDQPFESISPEPGHGGIRALSSDGESSIETPRATRPPHSMASSPSMDSLHAPIPRRSRKSRESDIESTDESSGVESDGSASSVGSSASGSPRTPRVLVLSSRASASSTSTVSKVPRSKQVIPRPAYKRYLIDTPPPVLVIHLKRFQQTTKSPIMSFSSSGFKKIEDFVAFPETLDITPFLAPKKEDYGLGRKSRPSKGDDKVKGKEKEKERLRKVKAEPCVYRLYTVVVHIGNMLGGHYVSYTALPSEPPAEDAPAEAEEKPRQWAYMSDHIVRLATLDEVLQSKAYICMYERI